jgi:phage-related protein
MVVIIYDMTYSIDYFNVRVQREIDEWPEGIRASYRSIAARVVEYGPDLGLPHTRAMGNGLFEIRAHGREGIGRALFCTIVGQRVVVLHAFIKKSPQTPEADLRLARKRLKEVRNG